MSAMTASERRQQIARLLSASQAPISATTLSQELGVSRQIIVGDIALLRAAGQEITATARGYVVPVQNGLLRRIPCMHSAEETRDELDAMVDCGCTVVDVIVEHPVYGQLTAPLHLSSRLDVDQFMKRMDGAAPCPSSPAACICTPSPARTRPPMSICCSFCASGAFWWSDHRP